MCLALHSGVIILTSAWFCPTAFRAQRQQKKNRNKNKYFLNNSSNFCILHSSVGIRSKLSHFPSGVQLSRSQYALHPIQSKTIKCCRSITVIINYFILFIVNTLLIDEMLTQNRGRDPSQIRIRTESTTLAQKFTIKTSYFF